MPVGQRTYRQVDRFDRHDRSVRVTENSMRVVVVGYGIQGKKRCAVAGGDLIATVDPVANGRDYEHIGDVPLERYDAALVCTPDETKSRC